MYQGFVISEFRSNIDETLVNGELEGTQKLLLCIGKFVISNLNCYNQFLYARLKNGTYVVPRSVLVDVNFYINTTIHSIRGAIHVAFVCSSLSLKNEVWWRELTSLDITLHICNKVPFLI